MPTQGDYGRAQRRLEVALETVLESGDAVVGTFVTTVADVLDLDRSCWHQTDPASAARARWDETAGSATARMHMPDGRWFILDASAMDGPGARSDLTSLATGTGLN